MSEAAAMGLHAIIFIAAAGKSRVQANQVASRLDVSAAHLSKVLQRLARSGLLRSTRGPAGGFVLSRPASKISLLEVYEAIEGPFTKIDCLLNRPICKKEKCEMVELAARIDGHIQSYFKTTTVADLAASFGSVDGILFGERR
jgi:Rrf2 family protein